MSPHTPTRDDPATRWQSLLDARLLGNNPPAPPEVVARREANDALFRGIARDRQRGRSRD